MNPRHHLGLATVLAATPAFAQVPHATPQEIVVTGSRAPESLSQALADVTVIGPQEIARAGQSTLAELLQSLGNVEIASSGGMGQPSSVFIRGANAAHTLVLVDGVRMGSATAGTTALENIPVDQIERIEILRGPASSLYGSDAIGGVIQVFTRAAARKPRLDASAGGGSYDTWKGHAGLSAPLGPASIALDVGRISSGGFSATKPDEPFGQFNPDRDRYGDTNATANIGYLVTPDHELGARAFYSDARTHFDAGPDTDDVNHQKLTSYSAFTRNRFASAWQSLLRAAKSTDDSVVTGAFPGAFRTDQRQLTWQNDIAVGPGRVTAGAERVVQHVDSTIAYTKSDRTTDSLFAGYAADYGAHGVQLNGRHDHDDQFGTSNTGLVAYGYRFLPSWRAVASVGSAFKAPTFNDLYFPLTYGYSGNPNLRPERSHSIEGGVHYDEAGRHFSALYFENRIHDLIAISSDFSTVVNVDQARIRGLELNYRGRAFGFDTHAGATFQDPRDEATGSLLPRRARRHADVSIGREVARWRLGAEGVFSSARFDSVTNDPASRLGGYGLMNLVASTRLGSAWSLQARWNNVFDRRYELVRGYNTPGSNVFVGIDYRFE